MDEKKKDLRIIKTRKALYNAFEELMKSKPFEQIKVSDICNEALINRSTFYAVSYTHLTLPTTSRV